MGKIFISHSSVNNAEALAIHDWLVEQGWGDVFLDLDPKRGLVAGDRWQAALKSAAEQCELILIIISPDWAKSRWCLAEFLLAKQMNKQILGVVVQHTPIADLPVELTAEWQLVDLSAPDVGWSATISPPRFEPETTVSFSGTGLARLRSGLEKAGLDATTFNWPPPHDLGRSPYRGLLPLDQDDAGIFFGRDGAIVLTLDALRGLRTNAAPRFATILGASGAGKSSFLRAGILPRLNRDSRHFYVLPIIRPERAALTGEHGFAAMLEAALKARNVTRNRADIRDAVKAGADAVAPILRELAIPADAGDVASGEPPTLVIAVDQAEELLSADNAEAGAFLTLLAALGRRDDLPVLVLFTVRSDSFDPLQSRPELAATQPHHLIDLPPVPAGSFGDIIRGPARRVTAAGRKLHVDETLVDALLSDIEVGGTKDALPLLAFTLERLYTDYGADGDLQLTEYERLGRIRGAIEAAVEQALGKADGNAAIPKDRAARLALLRRGLIPWLAGIDPNTGSPRRRVARLAEVPEEARPLIELMVEQRLLATDIDTATKERTIEPAHEALLRQWGALDGWLVEDSADLGTIEALRRAATEWDANARASEFVAHRGARLQAIEQVAAGDKFASYLTSVDRAYLSAARNMENGAIKKARAARTRLAIAASVVGIVLVAGTTAGYFIWSAGEAAKTQAAANFLLAQSEAALREGQPERAATFALDAYDAAPSTVTRTAALAGIMAVSPHAAGTIPIAERLADVGWVDATTATLLSPRGTTTTLDLVGHRTSTTAAGADGPPPQSMFPDGAGGFVVLRADASLARTDGSLIAAAPAAPFPIRGGDSRASADGKMLVLVGLIGDLLVRDCRSLPCVDTALTNENAGAVAVKPDGTVFAVGRVDGSVAIYTDPALPPRIVASFDKFVSALDWAHHADILAVAIGRSRVALVDPAGSAGSVQIDTVSFASTLEWSPSEGLLAIACSNSGEICVVDAERNDVARMTGHTAQVAKLHWSPDGQRLISVADSVRLWTLAQGAGAISTLRTGRYAELTALAIDREHGLVAAGDNRGDVWLWGADGRRHLDRPDDSRSVTTSLAFLSDGRLATVNDGIDIWSAGNFALEKQIAIDNASFSRIAAVSGDVRAAVPFTDGRIRVLSGEQLRESDASPSGSTLTPWGIAAAPGNNSVFVSHSDGSLYRRDLGAGSEAQIVFDASQPICGVGPTADNNGAKSLDVSADGKWLVATRADSQVVVHNLADPGKPLCLGLLAPDSKTVAFSPDGSKLAVLSATDRLYVFDLSAPDTAIILGAMAVPEALDISGSAMRATSWLDWLDDGTIAISTAIGGVERISIDPARWRARMDTVSFTP